MSFSGHYLLNYETFKEPKGRSQGKTSLGRNAQKKELIYSLYGLTDWIKNLDTLAILHVSFVTSSRWKYFSDEVVNILLYVICIQWRYMIHYKIDKLITNTRHLILHFVHLAICFTWYLVFFFFGNLYNYLCTQYLCFLFRMVNTWHSNH